MNISEIFIRRPVLSTVLAALILFLGLASVMNLPVRQYPEVEETVVTVTTIYPGAAPELIQGFVTSPIAAAVSTTEDIEYVTSSSSPSASVVTVQMKLGADPDIALTGGPGATGARPTARRCRGPGDIELTSPNLENNRCGIQPVIKHCDNLLLRQLKDAIDTIPATIQAQPIKGKPRARLITKHLIKRALIGVNPAKTHRKLLVNKPMQLSEPSVILKADNKLRLANEMTLL